MNTENLIMLLLLGGLLGIAGQGIRVIVGLKKINDNNTAAAVAGTLPTTTFNWSRMLLSIFIGFIAGVLGMLVKYFTATNNNIDITPQLIVAVIAGGYSGVDFIEGIFNAYLPKA